MGLVADHIIYAQLEIALIAPWIGKEITKTIRTNKTGHHYH